MLFSTALFEEFAGKQIIDGRNFEPGLSPLSLLEVIVRNFICNLTISVKENVMIKPARNEKPILKERKERKIDF